MDNENRNFIDEKIKGRRFEKNRLWKKAYEMLTLSYGEMPNLAILNRFYAEKKQFENDYSIVLWKLVSKIRHVGREKGFCTSLGGALGSSFVAYLLGATDTNPLPLHYFCRKCRCVEFVKEKLLPFDLPPRECECGEMMVADGFDIPYETLSSSSSTPSATLWVDPDFVGDTERIIRENMKNFRIYSLIVEDLMPIKYAFLPFGKGESICDQEDKCQIFSTLTVFPLITHKYARRLSEECEVSFFDVYDSLWEKVSDDGRITERFLLGKVNSIPYFRMPALNMSLVITTARPKSSYDILKVLGAVHGTNTWKNNAKLLIEDGICSIDEIPTHRDDVFMMLRDRFVAGGYSDPGIAYEIANKIRRGFFGKNRIDSQSRAILEYLNLPSWFTHYVEKIHYMFPKAHSAQNLVLSFVFMWYRVNFPEIYNKVMKEF